MEVNYFGTMNSINSVYEQFNNKKSGQISIISSVAGYRGLPAAGAYCASKSAVEAINKGMRMDLNQYNIRVSAIHPGLVETAFSDVRCKGDTERAKKVYQGYKALQPEDIAEIIHFVITRPYHINIEDLVVFPSAQASATIINKK